jgi:Flp pilus assembly secretin CpaC
MRRLPLAIAAVLTLSGAAANAQTGALPVKSASVALPLGSGEASYMSVGAPVRDVVVADPSVADVSIVNERTLIVMGKRPGVTTLMAFGAGGRTLTSRQVIVSEVGDGGVTVYRGVKVNSYACAAPGCTRLGASAAVAPGTP